MADGLVCEPIGFCRDSLEVEGCFQLLQSRPCFSTTEEGSEDAEAHSSSRVGRNVTLLARGGIA